MKILRPVLFWRGKMGYFWVFYEKILNFFYKVLIFSNMQYKNFFIFCLTNEIKVLYLHCQTTKKQTKVKQQKFNNHEIFTDNKKEFY